MVKPKIETKNGWTEVVLYDNCDFDKFYQVAEVLQTHFNVNFTRKLDDFDSLYWQFTYQKSNLTLHYNIYLGVSIYPKNCKDSSQKDNEDAEVIGNLLYQKLIELGY